MDTLIAEIGRVRDQYAECIRGGGSTDIEPWLAAWEGPPRAALFRLLLSVLIEESRDRDVTLYQSKLSEQFADYGSIIEELFESEAFLASCIYSGETRSYFVDTSVSATRRLQQVAHSGLPALPPLWVDTDGRYEILEELARGGMGAVLRAEDRELKRPVALKVILPAFRQNLTAVRRFHQEARITGQLQHPGIPPVHDVGALTNECPFFAMKLIEGEALSSLLKLRISPADDLPRFVAIFENICQAVAYAHTRGVVHRDLKPANIMVGEFGEVQVMDWGLARWIREPDRHRDNRGNRDSSERNDSSEILQSRGDELTQAGAAMGTPAYMPPEQACGLNDAIDERSDVFGLAGILCVILTGRPPYSGATTAEILEKCYRADLREAHERLNASGAPAELIRIARQGLSSEPSDRPGNAALVAQEIKRYRESAELELQSARIRQAAEEARALERRNRRLAWGLVTVAAVLIVGLVGFGGWRAFREARQFAATAEQKLKLTEQQLLSTKLASMDPQRMKILLDTASSSLDELETQVSATGRRLSSEGALQLERLRTEAKQLQNDQSILEAFRESRKRATEVDTSSGFFNDQQAFQELISELQRFGISPQSAAPGEFAESLRERHPEVARQLSAVLQFTSVQTSDPQLSVWLLETLTELDAAGEQRVLLDFLRGGDFEDNAGVLEKIAPENYSPELLFSVAQRMRDSAAQLRFLRRARFAWPNDFWLNHLLGNQCEATTYLRENHGNPELINSLHVEAISCLNAAAAIEPDNVGNIVNLGIALQNWGDRQAALKMFSRAIELDPNYGAARVMKGGILMQLDQFQEGVTEFETAVRVAPDFAPGYANLARWHGQNGRFDQAAELLRKAVALKPLADYYLQLGRAYGAMNDYDRAIPEWEKAVELDPNLFEANFILGLTSLDRKQIPRGVSFLEQAHRIRPQDLETLLFLGTAYRENQEFEKAIKAWRDALVIDENHGPAHAELGKHLYLAGRKEEAIHHLVRMHELGLGDSNTRVHMAIELADLGRIDEARNACREAIKANPQHSNAWFTLSELQAHTGDLDEAIDSARRATEIDDPRKPPREVFDAKLAEYERQRMLKSEQDTLTVDSVAQVESSKLIELAKMSHEWREHYHLATRLYERRFSEEFLEQYPSQPTERFFAACAAAMASSERHYDPRVAASDHERTECRRLALEWISAELAEWKQMYPNLPAQSQASMHAGLKNWLKDPRLNSVREPAELDKLTPSERQAWQSFWTAVNQGLQPSPPAPREGSAQPGEGPIPPKLP